MTTTHTTIQNNIPTTLLTPTPKRISQTFAPS